MGPGGLIIFRIGKIGQKKMLIINDQVDNKNYAFFILDLALHLFDAIEYSPDYKKSMKPCVSNIIDILYFLYFDPELGKMDLQSPGPILYERLFFISYFMQLLKANIIFHWKELVDTPEKRDYYRGILKVIFPIYS